MAFFAVFFTGNLIILYALIVQGMKTTARKLTELEEYIDRVDDALLKVDALVGDLCNAEAARSTPHVPPPAPIPPKASIL